MKFWMLSGLRSSFFFSFKAMLKIAGRWTACNLVLINRAYASLPVCYHAMLKLVFDNKVANLMLDFVDFKVAHRIESVKVAKVMGDELRSGRLIFCVICWNFEFLMYLLILIGYFIWSSALLCCFELLIDWWRNRWVESYWYKIFLCGIEVFECFEELFFAESFIWCF